jgi:hypothetical protein
MLDTNNETETTKAVMDNRSSKPKFPAIKPPVKPLLKSGSCFMASLYITQN